MISVLMELPERGHDPRDVVALRPDSQVHSNGLLINIDI